MSWRDKDGWHFDADMVLLYLLAYSIVIVGVIALAIKAIRWAVAS